MNDIEANQSWERAKKMAFWDQGKLTYRHWLRGIKAEVPNVIRQSVNQMRASDLIVLMGQKEFIQSWPSMREIDVFNENKKVILDAAWGFYAVGDTSFPVNCCVNKFHPKKRETLRALVRSTGNDSIYSIAKSTGRNPRRVYDDVHDFVDRGLVILESGLVEGRKTLFPKVRGCHI